MIEEISTKEASEFMKFLQKRMKDYLNIFKLEENEWPRNIVNYLDKEMFNKLDHSRALTLSVSFLSSFNDCEVRLNEIVSRWEIKE